MLLTQRCWHFPQPVDHCSQLYQLMHRFNSARSRRMDLNPHDLTECPGLSRCRVSSRHLSRNYRVLHPPFCVWIWWRVSTFSVPYWRPILIEEVQVAAVPSVVEGIHVQWDLQGMTGIHFVDGPKFELSRTDRPVTTRIRTAGNFN